MLEDLIQLHRAGRLDEAEQGYRQLLATSPDDPEVLHLLGILRGQRDDLHEALQLVTRASELDPENATCRHTLGEMYLAQGNLDEAAAAYDQARMLNPNLAATHAGLGQVAFLRGDLDAAKEHFRVTLRADENNAQALAGLGNIAQMHGDSKRALQLLTQAAEQAPHDPLIQTSYAQAMLDQGMLDFAAKALDNALAIKPDYPLARAARAELHVRKGDIASALPIYQSLLERGEQVGPARVGMGDVARLQGRREAAIAEYDEALRVQPDLHPAAIRRAIALAVGGRAPQAIDDLRDYLSGNPDGIKVHTLLANLLTQTGRYDEAVAAWRAAEARWPDDVDLKARHALTLDRAGRAEEALALADAAAASPRPALAVLRARGALLEGDPAAAVQRLLRIDNERLAGKPPRLAQRRQRLLGLAYDALEQWPDAVVAFMAAQDTGSGLPELAALDDASIAMLQRLAAEPELAEPRDASPVLLCGLPGSGVGQVAALLSEQPGWFVRRERATLAPDFVTAPFDERLLKSLDQTRLGLLARRYQRPLERAKLPASTRVADWIPALDVRVLPALKRALPGLRLLIVRRQPHDMLLDWLGYGSMHGFAMPDPLAGARWLRLAQTHLALAADLVPTLVVDPDALLAAHGEDARKRLGEFLDIGEIVADERTRAAGTGPGGLPLRFPAGHATHYRESLSEAFALLDDFPAFALP